MSNETFLLQNASEIENCWIIDDFNSVYPEFSTVKGCAVATLAKDATGNPDTMALVTLRTFIENSSRAQIDQKYVVGIRFYSFGDIASIDVISLDKDFHKEIAYAHISRFGWPLFDIANKSIDYFDETTRAPFAIAGGHLKIGTDDAVSFSGSSGDYGDSILFSDSNAIAAYVASACGMPVIQGDIEKGKQFVDDLLAFMLEHKLQKDFYEKLTDEVFKRNSSDRPFIHQHIGAFMTMKAADRVITERKDMLQAVIEEMVDGYGRYFLVAGVAKKVRANKEE